MTKDVAYYQQQFTKLRVSKNWGIAPHQPILLLSVLEQVEQQHITANEIYPNANLIATFSKYWSYLAGAKHRNKIYQPFYHLKSSSFWHLKAKFGLEEIIQGFKPKSLSSLTTLIDYAYLDKELFELLQTQNNRDILTLTLLETWFPEKQDLLKELFKRDAFQEILDEYIKNGGKIYAQEDLEIKDAPTSIVRDSAFRKVLVSVYDYRCCFCGLRIIDTAGLNIVDGCHIKSFSQFRDDRIVNGLSLCKNHHWAFDKGWFAVDEKYKILVKKEIDEIAPNNKKLEDFNGTKILMPNQSQYYPDKDALGWHFDKIFKKKRVY